MLDDSDSSLTAIDFWYARAILNQNPDKDEVMLEQGMFCRLGEELPSTVEVTFERTCMWDCAHCLFQPEPSSLRLSKIYNLDQVVLNIVRQLPFETDSQQSPSLIHGGRILRPWHLELLDQVRRVRPDVEIGLIDNGSYTRLQAHLKDRNFTFNWIDISVDGLEQSHNRQRDPQGKLAVDHTPWRTALRGLEAARAVTGYRSGAVHVLMTITKLNYRDVEGLARFVLDSQLADHVHFALMTPARAVNHEIDPSSKELGSVWKQLLALKGRYGSELDDHLTFKIFETRDLLKLEQVVGSETLWRALTDFTGDTGVNVANGNLMFAIDDMPVSYYPVSLWPREAFLIDADAVVRYPHMQQFTVAELRTGAGISKKYSVAQLTGRENYPQTYLQGIRCWTNDFGQGYLEEDVRFFQELRERGERRMRR